MNKNDHDHYQLICFISEMTIYNTLQFEHYHMCYGLSYLECAQQSACLICFVYETNVIYVLYN